MIIELTSDNWYATTPEIIRRLKTAKFTVALTGAGISVASGLPLIGDVVKGVEVNRIFERGFFQKHPQEYYRVYRYILQSWRKAEPNPAHIALARHHVWIVTLNVDGLHLAAGSRHVIELHGSLRELRCVHCGLTVSSEMCTTSDIPVCGGCGSILWPGFTLVGEEIRHYNRAVDWVGRAEILFVVGTSLEVEPACWLPSIAGHKHDACIIYIRDHSELLLPRLFRG